MISKEEKIRRILNQKSLIPQNSKLISLFSNLDEKSEETLSYILQRIRLYRYRYSDKGKQAEKKFQNSEHGKDLASKRRKRFKGSDKDKEWKSRRKPICNKIYRQKNKEKIKNYRDTHRYLWINYRLNNKDRINEKQRNRWKTDPNYKLKNILRHRLWLLVKKEYKIKSAIELLGCSLSDFKKHIELKFTEEMTWNKLMSGEIHLDHIIPCSKFNLKCSYHQKLCFHFTNIQPLWAVTKEINGTKYLGNINKGDS